jgi:hypothetical protein
MNSFRLVWTTVRVVSVVVVVGACNPVSGQVIGVVSPSATATTEGNDSSAPTLIPARIQHLIPASDFANLPASQRRLMAFNFRADATQNQSISWNNGGERVWMSTTSLNVLTTNFDSNHGVDRTLVHDGDLPFPLLATGPAGGPKNFAAGTRLNTPFVYDPSKGNLLIERLIFGVNPSAIATIDTQLTSFNRFLVSTNPNSAIGILASELPVLRFEFVPEPTTIAITGFLSMILLAWHRKSRS